MRRYFATLAAACAAAVTLAACGGSADPCADSGDWQACAALQGNECPMWRAAYISPAGAADILLTPESMGGLPDAELQAHGERAALARGLDPADVTVGTWCDDPAE